MSFWNAELCHSTFLSYGNRDFYSGLNDIIYWMFWDQHDKNKKKEQEDRICVHSETELAV